MKKKRFVAAAIAAMLCTATAHAQWVVVDPTNLVQNTLTAIRTLEQINNQIQQLQNEAQMLMNQARNLASLPSSVVNQLRANLATTERLIAQARGLAYDVTNLDREFARLYPEQYAATVSGDQMYRDAQERWRNTLNGLQTTMQMQAQVSQNLGEDESVLADLVGKSQSAEGALQAMQAMNQLLALQAKQSIQSQRLQITQDRATSLELARQAAATERAREVRRRFLGEGTPYTPQRDGRPPCDASSPCRFRCLWHWWPRAATSRPTTLPMPWPPIPYGSRHCARNARPTARPRARTLAAPPPKPSDGASSPVRPGRMNTRRWPTCRRSRRASMNRAMARRRHRRPNRRARHE